MNMQEIRVIAKNHEIKTSGLSKADLVKAIQREEGNFDCYATASDGNCDQSECLWRKDCMTAAQA